MDNQLDRIIEKQEGLIAALQEQLKVDQALIDSQEGQIRLLKETIAILEKEQQKLTEAGNAMAAASQRLEKICYKQQELLDSFLSEK